MIKQLVNFPARKENKLDLLLTNRPGLLNTCKPIMGIAIGDHDTGVITDTYCCHQRHKPVKRAINCWNRANIGDLRTDMLNNLTTVCQNSTIDTH